jgi:PKHD-type hydroxylase
MTTSDKSPVLPNAAWPFIMDTTEYWAYWDNVFTPEECQQIIALGNSKIAEEASFIKNTSEGQEQLKADNIRDSDIVWLYAADNMSWAFSRLTDIITSINSQYFNFDLFGFVEGFQFTRYDAPAGNYGKHIDKVFQGPIRKLSITIQLSDPDDYEGGDLLLHYGFDPITAPREQAKLVAFPSYMLHEVTPVTKGTRYSLVAWITGAPFK